MSLPTKKMSPKKGYMEIGGYFYLGTHIKSAGLVTFILLAKFQALFNEATCSKYSVINYVKFPVFNFLKEE